jgi:hypothetical protein
LSDIGDLTDGASEAYGIEEREREGYGIEEREEGGWLCPLFGA